MGLNEFGLCELVDMVKSGEVSPSEVANDLFAAVEAIEPKTRSYIEFYAEDLLKHARLLTDTGDYRTTRFAGLPISLKDNIVVQNKVTTCGSRMLAAWSSPYDATVVERLAADGAVIAGKTNLDEFGMGSPSVWRWFKRDHATGTKAEYQLGIGSTNFRFSSLEFRTRKKY